MASLLEGKSHLTTLLTSAYKYRSWATGSHLPNLQSSPHYKITALQNSSKKSAEDAAKHYNLGDVSAHDNPASIANDPNVDIVAVSVKVTQHYELLKPALAAGKDVFSEWPLARTLQEAEELTALAKEKGVRTMIGLQARQSPSVLKAKEIVESGKLGKILGTTMFGHGMLAGNIVPESYAYSLDVENGGNLLTVPFSHAVDALCYVLGEIKDLSATLGNNLHEVTIVDKDMKPIRTAKKTAHEFVSITGTLVSGGNVDVQYAGDKSRTGRDFYWEIIGTDGSLVLEGPNGHIQMYQPSVKFVGGEQDAKLEQIEVEKAGRPDEGDFSFNVGRAWDALAGVGLEKGGSVTTWDEALVRHKMIDAVYRSAETGKRQSYL